MNILASGLPQLCGLLIAIVLPAVTALVSRRSYSRTTKALIHLALAAASSVLAVLARGDSLDSNTIVAVIYTFVIGVAAYAGLLKGTALHDTLLDTLNVSKAPPLAPAPGSVVSEALYELSGDGLPSGFTMPEYPLTIGP